MINTVTVHYHPDGFTNDITDDDSHETNLFQPEVTVTKEGPELSKVGDVATYTFTIENTGSDDSPNLIMNSIDDSIIGNLEIYAPAECSSIAPGDSCTFDVDYTVQAGDDDPLINTVTVHYHPDGFTNDITDDDSHETNLFQPEVTVTKEGPELSKVGDVATYTFTITNTGSSDSPNLIMDSINDDVIGNLEADAPATCDDIAVGDSCTFDVDYTVQAGDDDPLINTVTVHYHPDGFTNDITDDDSHETNLFQPSVEIVKEGPALSKATDVATYKFTITNTGSSDSPNLILASIDDTLQGDLMTAATNAGCDNLAPGDFCTFNVDYTVQVGDPDPLDSTVTVHYNPLGFPNDITDDDSESTELFQPAVEVTKTADPTSVLEGDTVTYTYVITNTGSSDSPNLIMDSIDDDKLGNLEADAPAACDELAVGDSCTFDVDYITTHNDMLNSPIVNVVTVHYHPLEFTNNITDDATATVDVLPLTGTVTIVKVTEGGGDGTFTFTSDLPTPAGFTLNTLNDVGGDHRDQKDWDPVQIGTYHVTEQPLSGWKLKSIVCEGTGANPSYNGATATFTVAGQQNVQCTFTNIPVAPTRTLGYWSTHPDQVRSVLHTGTGTNYGITGSNVLTVGGTTSGKLIDDLPTVFGAFWSSISKDSNSVARDSLSQAKMQLMQQLMAAELNCRAFGSTPGTDPLHPANNIIDPATCSAPVGTAAGNALNVSVNNAANRAEVIRIAGLLDGFNNSGDLSPFPSGFVNSSANKAGAVAIANAAFTDAGNYLNTQTGIQGYNSAFWKAPYTQPFDI